MSKRVHRAIIGNIVVGMRPTSANQSIEQRGVPLHRFSITTTGQPHQSGFVLTAYGTLGLVFMFGLSAFCIVSCKQWGPYPLRSHGSSWVKLLNYFYFT